MGTGLGSSLSGPLWRRAPINLLRWPDLVTAVIASAVLLGLAAGVAPPFLSSAASASFANAAGQVESALAGATVTQQVGLSPHGLNRRTEILDRSLADLPGIQPVIATIVGDTVTLESPRSEGGVTGQMIARTDARDHVEVIERGTGPGVWISDFQAEQLHIGVGDQIKLVGRFRGSVTARVAAIYKALAATPVTDYWRPLYELIYSSTGDAVPPPFVIAQPHFFSRFGPSTAQLFSHLIWTEARWEYRLDASAVSVAEARSVAQSIQRVSNAIANGDEQPNSPFSHFRFANTNTVLPDLVADADATTSTIKLPVVLMSLAAVLVALAMIGAAGAFSVRRRRVETVLLATRGVGAVAFGIRSVIESLLPLFVGAMLGWACSAWIVAALGPSARVDASARHAALLWVCGAFVVATATLGACAGFAARRETENFAVRSRLRVKGPLWETALLAMAVVSYAAFAARGAAEETGAVDALVIVFPVLLIAGGAGLGARGLARVLPRLRKVGVRARPAVYLALRRLAAARKVALLLVAAVALATGVLVYSGALARSVEATSITKSQVATGSDFAADLELAAPAPRGLPFPATEVHRVQQVALAPGGLISEVLVIDTATFEDAAFWNRGFSDSSLDGLLEALDGPVDRGLPVVVVGGAPVGDENFLTVLSSDVPLTVVGRASAWPGMHSGLITLVASRDAVDRLQESGESSLVGVAGVRELWAKGDPESILNELEARDIGVTLSRTAEDARTTPGLLAAGWILGFLQAVGAGAGLIAVAGVALYLQARARAGVISWALTRRMGLRPWSFRASIALEVAAMLVISLAMGTGLALIAAGLVYKRFDVLPTLPPGPVFAAPVATVALALAALLVAAALAGLRTQRFARRSNVAETLRTSG